MKICHVLSSMSVGGMERVVSRVISLQSDSNCEPYLFCTDNEGEFFDDASALQKICAFRNQSSVFIDHRVLRRLLQFLRLNDVDVVHAHNHLGLIYGAIAAIRLKLPIVVTMHGQGAGYGWKAHMLERLLLNRASKVAAVSSDAREVLINKKLAPADKIVVIPNGIRGKAESGKRKAETRTEKRKELGLSSDVFVVGAVGRLVPEKNYGLLIDAFASIAETRDTRHETREAEGGRDVVLLIIGDGPERDRLEKQVKDCGVSDKVIFAGMQDDVAPFYDAMDAFCLPSLTEGMSMTLLEAGAVGLPSVVTDVGGNAEIVEDNVSGFVVKSEDREALVQALSKLYDDKELRASMGNTAHEIIRKQFSMTAMMTAYAALYNEVVGKAEG